MVKMSEKPIPQDNATCEAVKPGPESSGGQPPSFLRHALVYGCGTLLLQAATIVLLPLYTNYLTPAEFGLLDILYRIGDILNICLMSSGIGLAAMTFYRQAKKEQEREQIAATISLFLLILLIVGAALTVGFASPLSALLGIDDPTLLVFGVFAALLQTTTMIPLTLMQARIESFRFVCASFAIFLTRVTLTIAAVAWFGWGLWGVLGALGVTSLVFGLGLTLRELAKGSFRPDMSKLRETARFALPFVPGGLCFFVLHNGDRFFLVRFAGAEELGLYALGYKLAMAVGMLGFAPLMKVWSARMYDAFELPNASLIVGQAVTRMLAAYLFVGTGLCILKDEVIAILGSPEYAGAGAVIGLIVLACYFMTASTLMDAVFYVRRRTALKPWIAAVSALVILALYAWLIPKWGAIGAAYATLGGFFFHAIATFLVSQRVFRVAYEFPRLAGMLVTSAALVFLSGRLGVGVSAIPAKMALCAAWPVLLWATGMITDDEKRWAASTIQHVRGRLHRFSAGDAVGTTANTAD